MTDDQINDAIAQKLMGLSPCHCVRNENGYSAFGYDSETGRCKFCGNGAVPNYLTNPADSKMVREKLAESGWRRQELKRSWIEPAVYTFEIEHRERMDTLIVGPPADTEERAVALCALRSVGVDPTPSPQ